MTIDIRHPDETTLADMDQRLRQQIEEITTKIGLTYNLDQIFSYDAVPFEQSCVDAVREAADRCGYSHRDIVSGAGHDACYLANVAPTGMIFVPCIDGISHNEVEDAKPEWITAGADVLMQVMLQKAAAHPA